MSSGSQVNVPDRFGERKIQDPFAKYDNYDPTTMKKEDSKVGGSNINSVMSSQGAQPAFVANTQSEDKRPTFDSVFNLFVINIIENSNIRELKIASENGRIG